MDIDEVLVNLKVLEQIQVNQKLISRGQYLNIEYESLVPEWIRRWRRQDNRNETIKKINIIINSALKLKTNNDELSERLDPYLDKSVSGLKALKETYAVCCQTTARIDVIISKIKNSLNKHEETEKDEKDEKCEKDEKREKDEEDEEDEEDGSNFFT